MRRVVLLASIWGWSFLFVKVARHGFSPWVIAWGRSAIGAVFLLGLVRYQGKQLRWPRAQLGHLALLGLISCAIPFTLQALAQKWITSSLASVLNASTPLFAGLFAVAFFSDALRRPQVVGLMLGFFGVAVAAGVLDGGVGSASGIGVAMMAGSTISYGIGFNLARRHLQGVDPVMAATGQQIFGALMMLPIAMVSLAADGAHPTSTSVLSLVLLGALGTGLAWVINFGNIAALGASKASSVTFLVPIVAITLTVIVPRLTPLFHDLREPLQLHHAVGGLITLLGVALLQERLMAPAALPVAV